MSKEDNNLMNAFGLTPNWRRGLLMGIITALIAAVIALYYDNSRFQRDMIQMNERKNKELTDKLLNVIIPSVEKVNNVADKVDTVASRADSTLKANTK